MTTGTEAETEETKPEELEPKDICELMAPTRWTEAACQAYASSWSETCRACPARPAMKKIKDPRREYEMDPIPGVPRMQPTIKKETIMPPLAAELPDTRTRQGICLKCDEMRTIVKDGMCTGCNYGPNKTLTREEVLAKKSKPIALPAGAPKLQIADPPPPVKKEVVPVKPERKSRTATCFFCAAIEEHNNTVGDITFNDGAHERKIYVCHYCASESLQNLLTNADPALLPGVMGELMYKRAIESRA